MNSVPDALIGSATADVAVHGGVDIGVGWFWFARQESGGSHDLAGLAVSALRHLFRDPGGLKRVCRRCGQSLDCSDFSSPHTGHSHAACADRVPVDVHGAGAALLKPAAELGAGQADGVAKNPEQRRVRGDIDLILFSVYRERDHSVTPLECNWEYNRS